MSETALWRGSTAQRIRLLSGLVLFAFAATHFLNHALALVSLDAVAIFDGWRKAVTRSAPGIVVLVAALLSHITFSLWPILKRRTWSMPVWQWVQIVLGLAIPLQLLVHIIGTGVTAAVFGVDTTYVYEFARIWTATILPQSALLLAVWVHGCIGVHFWLRLWRPYPTWAPVLLSLAVLVPFAALAGVSVGGRAVQAAMADPTEAAAIRNATHWPDEETAATLQGWNEKARLTYAGALVALGLGVFGTTVVVGRRKRIPIRYVDGPTVLTEPGPTLLDISRRNGIPHTAVCGGRGRCSTCRVLVLDNEQGLTPPGPGERRTLLAIGAGPHVRLACQAVPVGGVTILPLVKSLPTAGDRSSNAAEAEGTERDLAVLFVDLRGFTSLTERRLPFDVIYILNQFFAAAGQPIHAFGGWIANYAGDGIIALFSNEAGLDGACRSALLATAEIDRAMVALNERLGDETRQPLRIAMGLHAGAHVMGRVGFGATQPMSVVGLAVNVASRLEAVAKQEGVQLALSGVVADHGGLDRTGLRTAPIDVRGVSEPVDVVFVPRARDLLLRLRRDPDAPRQSGERLQMGS